jgi:hypothetical protein
MSQAHPLSSTAQPGTSGGVHGIDLVAGDPPVPITVWRTPAGDDQSSIPSRLAHRLVATYSRPGETVVDLTDDHVLTDAARAGARRHHKAWFTDANAVIVATPTPHERTPIQAPARSAVRGHGRRAADLDPAEVAAWFGDDLTAPDLGPHQRTAPHPGADTVAAVTSLVVAVWPLHALDATHQARLGWLLHAGERLLRRGGCLVLVVGAAAGASTAPEDFSPLVGAAHDAGLGYLQHIVAVSADVEGDQFVYYATDEELLALAHSGRWAVAHLRVHADLIVFHPLAGGGARG